LRHRKSVGEYLAFLSIKHYVEPEKSFSALHQAGAGMKTDCGKFSIECRGRIEKKQVFLVRDASGVVAQFRVPDEFFLESGDSIGKLMNAEKVRGLLLKKKNAAHFCLIKDVRPGMKHVNLKAKVLSVAEPRRVVTRFGNYAEVAKALIGDETGAISLCLWNEQINAVSVGDTVHVGDAKASDFKGEKQLTVGARGVLSNAEGFESIATPCLPIALKA